MYFDGSNYVMEVEDMANELYRDYGIDYSYTTLKEAEPMIREDYEDMSFFNRKVWDLMKIVDEVAGEVFEKPAVREYFNDKFNYEEADDIVALLLDYMYNHCI